MPREKSCGAILFRKENNKFLFLLLHYAAGHWDFVKGHVEKGETNEQTVLRELKEETGITEAKILAGFEEKISYYYKRGKETVFKEVFFYLLETKEKEVKLSFEHQGFEWLELKQAIERVTFKNAKEILEKANEFLKTAKA